MSRRRNLLARILIAGLLALAGAAVAMPAAQAAPDPGDLPPGTVTTFVTCDADNGIPDGLTRAQIVARARRWVDANVPYSMTACHTDGEGRAYRTDCSGFVSMAWGLDGSATTAGFMQDNSRWKTIAWADLQPGDALVHPKDSQHPYGHIVLFVSWANSAHTAINDYEEHGTSTGTIANRQVVADMKGDGYHPIRYTRINEATPVVTERSFIRNSVTGEIYRVAGGAPVYVTSWDAFGGSQTTINVSPAYIAAMNPYPADGTFVTGAQDGRVYRIAGGAPTYVSTWAPFGGAKPTVTVDALAIDRAGTGGAYDHLRTYPADGTFVAGAQDDRVYRIAGGAPVYVTTWDAFDEPQPTVTIDTAALDRAGTGGAYDHLRYYPADGTFVAGAQDDRVYRIAGGAPLYVSSWAIFGGAQPTVTIDTAALDRAGAGGAFNHLRYRPADGTFVVGRQDGRVYRIAGGAPIYVSSWAIFGGAKPTTTVDATTLDHAGAGGAYDHLAYSPADGTFIRGIQTGRIYRVAAGVPTYLSSWDPYGGPQPTTDVDQTAIDKAGQPAPYDHLTA